MDVFIAQHLADARLVSRRSGVPASVILAQSGLESGWGMHVVSNAYFGVKGKAPSGKSTRFVTHEVSNGVAHKITDSFRGYANYTESANDYADVLRRHYPLAFAHSKNSLLFVTHLRGYATDPHCAAKLQQIIRIHKLQQYDGKP